MPTFVFRVTPAHNGKSIPLSGDMSVLFPAKPADGFSVRFHTTDANLFNLDNAAGDFVNGPGNVVKSVQIGGRVGASVDITYNAPTNRFHVLNNTTELKTAAFVKSIGQSNAVAKAMEDFSQAMPRNGRVNSPLVPEQGVIELGAGAFPLERTLNIDLTGTAVSKYGLTIRGQGNSSTLFTVPANASPANFKGGDGVWRALKMTADRAGSISRVRLENFGVVSYMTQDGDGTRKLTDPLALIDLLYLLESEIVGVSAYNRNLTPMSMNQIAIRLVKCYYSYLRSVRVNNFSGGTGVAMDGSTQARWGGVGFRFEENNALTVINPMANAVNLAYHFFNEQGAKLVGGAAEHINKVFLFDGYSKGCQVSGLRPEFHFLDSKTTVENPEEIYIAKFTETTADNKLDLTWTPSVPMIKSVHDLSLTKSNRVDMPSLRRSENNRNLLSGAWTNAANMSSTNSSDVPPGYEGLTSTEITSSGAYNVDRYQTVAVNPEVGSLTFRIWLKRVSGNGMILPQIQYVINQRLHTPLDTDLRYQSLSNIPLETTGHSWANTDGGELTLNTKRPHNLQPGMRLQAGGAYGTIALDTNLYVKATPTHTSLVFAQATDPGAIASPAALKVPTDMLPWQAQPNVTDDWQVFVGTASLRWIVSGIALNANSAPVLTFLSAGQVPPVGSKIRLLGFKDSRLKKYDYTVMAGDISGATLTITGLNAAGMDVTTAAITGSDSQVPVYGMVGLTEVRVSMRTVTTSNTPIVWRVMAETLLCGSREVVA